MFICSNYFSGPKISMSPSTLGESPSTWATGNWRRRGSNITNTEREACRPSTTYYGGSTVGNKSWEVRIEDENRFKEGGEVGY